MSNIYGIDTNDAAESISRSALGSPKAVNAISQSAVSKGNLTDDLESDATVKESHSSSGSDGRADSKGI